MICFHVVVHLSLSVVGCVHARRVGTCRGSHVHLHINIYILYFLSFIIYICFILKRCECFVKNNSLHPAGVGLVPVHHDPTCTGYAHMHKTRKTRMGAKKSDVVALLRFKIYRPAYASDLRWS